MIAYVDTSVMLKLLVDDEVGGDAAQRLWLDADYLVCAEIGYVEARAALAKHRRRQRLVWIVITFAAIVAAVLILWEWDRRIQKP